MSTPPDFDQEKKKTEDLSNDEKPTNSVDVDIEDAFSIKEARRRKLERRFLWKLDLW